MSTRLLQSAAAAVLLLGTMIGSSSCQQVGITCEPGRILSFRRVAMMDTVTAVLHGQVASLCRKVALPATVQLAGPASFRTVADAAGKFQFMHIPAGTYRLSATCQGHGALTGDTIHLGFGAGSEISIGLGCRVAAG